MAAQVREDFADLDATLAVFSEAERRTHQVAGLPLCSEVSSRHGLAVVFGQHWLWVKCIDLREAAVQEQKNDVLRPGREMEVLACKRVLKRSGRSGAQQGSAEQVRQSDDAEPAAQLAQRLPPSHGGNDARWNDSHFHLSAPTIGISSQK